MKRSTLRTISILGFTAACATGCPGGDDSDSSADTDDTTGGTDGPTTNTATNTMSATSPDTSVGPTDPDTSSSETTPTTTETAGALAQVRVIHSAPGAGNVDVYAAGSDAPVVADLAYGGASAYLEVPAGDYVFEIRPAGAAPDSEPVFTTESITLAEDTLSSAVAVGVIGSKDADSAFRVLALSDEFGDPGDGVLVRVLHAGADAPTVGIDIGRDGDVEVEALERFAATDAAGLALPADEAFSIGILVDGAQITQFSTPPLPAEATILVVATGLVSSLPREETGFGLLAVVGTDAFPIFPQDPKVYALHAFAPAAPVDVCFEGAVLANGLTWADPTTSMASFQVAPGTYSVSLQADADDCQGDDIVGGISTGALAAGQQYLATVGSTSNGLPQLVVATEGFSLDLEGQGAVAIVHGAQAPTVTAGVVDGDGEIPEALLFSIDNGSVTSEEALDPATYFLGVGTGNNRPITNVVGAADVEIIGGERAWIVVAGNAASVGAENNDDLRYRIVDTSEHPLPWTVSDVLLIDVQ